LQAKLTSLQSNYATLFATTQRGALNTLTVIEPASRPVRPVGPNKASTIALAGAVGFVLAASAAYLLEYLDDSVKTPDEVTQLTGLPTLSGIARIQEEAGQKLITHTHPRSPISEAFRVLRTGIQFSSLDKPNRLLLVTSPNPSEGKSTLAANLATVVAQAGNNVLLIDADLRRPTQHKVFGLSDKHGLTSLLLEMSMNGQNENVSALLSNHVQKTPINGLNVMTSGPIPPNPSELLGSAKMKGLLDILESNFDIVIIDSPPILAVTDAVVLSTQTDGLLLVIDADKTRRGALKQSVDRLREVNANIIGVALNRLSLKSDGYRYYYYYESSQYYMEDSDNGKSPNGKSLNGKSANGSSPNGSVKKGLLGRWRKEASHETEH
jgi:polysaccharide biosynthesis transport protein